MLLAFDVGNTNIVLGVFNGDTLVQNWRLATDKNTSADEYGMILNQLFQYEKISMKDITDVIISTVVPPVLYALQHMCQKYFNRRPIIIGPGVKTGVIIKYDNPKQIGSDRIVNVVAAHAKYPGNLIIVDFGTATTFDAVTDKPEYLGGTIAPGLKISGDALFEKTAKLPRVEIEKPGHVICKNTIESMQSGLVYGYMGLVDSIIDKMKDELAAHTGRPASEITVIGTGGFATLISSGTKGIDHVDRMLTLDGLKLIYDKNKQQ